MSISSLAREMITEYESMIGRQITPTEYLQFREQAMREIQNGFNECVSSKPACMSTNEYSASPACPSSNEHLFTNVMPDLAQCSIQAVPKQQMVQELHESDTSADGDLLMQNENKKNTQSKKNDKKESVTEVDPFFLLIDKMDA